MTASSYPNLKLSTIIMASKTMLRTLRPLPAFRSFHPRRSFINLPGTEATSLSETRILPYKYTSLYALIADVDSYSSFLPYCQESKVTEWSTKDKDGKTWPAKADLTVGWGGYEEKFTSRLLCIPNSVVEALGGGAQTTLSRDNLKHYSSISNAPTAVNIFKSLSTKWTVKPLHYKPPSGRPQTDNAVHPRRDQTEVHLTIVFQFSNPLYTGLSKAVAPKVAGVMIEAFERRARKLLDRPGTGIDEKDSLGRIIGSQKVDLR
jgi:coenzyme Q-binding protein COQ10